MRQRREPDLLGRGLARWHAVGAEAGLVAVREEHCHRRRGLGVANDERRQQVRPVGVVRPHVRAGGIEG
eukprot:1612049-Rhodomonas_salina.1